MAQAKKSAKKSGVRLEDLMFYFDGVERDRIDAAGTSRKTGEVLALRDRLLRLPDDEFDATIKTVKGILVDSATVEDPGLKRDGQRAQARELFDQSKSASVGKARVGKVAPA